jgi:hypothetical protein
MSEEYLGVTFDLHEGAPLRASPEEADVLDVPTQLDFETSLPGGHGPGNITLPRPDNWDPMDGALLASSRIFDQSGRNVHEGRVVGMPHTGVNEIQIQLEGWAKHLEANETAREIFVDRDKSHWTEPSRAYQIFLLGLGAGYESSEVATDVSAGVPALLLKLTDTWGTAHYCPSQYDAGSGLTVGSIYYDFVSSLFGGDIEFYIRTDDNDGFTSAASSANLIAASGSGTHSPTTPERFAHVQFGQPSAGGTDGFSYVLQLLQLIVFGAQGLSKQGSGADQGYLVSDMVSYVVSKYAPLLNITPDSIEQTSFVVPQAAFTDDTTAKAIVEALLLFGGSSGYPLDYGVYDDRGFFLKSPGTYGDVWRVRRDEGAESLDQGPDVEGQINGVKVSYGDGTGTTLSVGPIGSGSDLETDLVTITDPNHPRNKIGERAWKKLDAGITSSGGATLLGQLYLNDKNTQEWRGDVSATGEQRDSTGNVSPPYMLRAGDRVVLEDDPDTRERRIVGTSYDSDKRSVKLSIGQKPDRIDSLLARAGVVVSDLG